MCARYTVRIDVSDIRNLFAVATVDLPAGTDTIERYNAAPTQRMPVITAGVAGARTLSAFRWGLVPVWAKDVKIGATMINARAETVAEKPSFGRLLKRQRCLVPATGFFEWKKTGPGPKDRLPVLLRLASGNPFVFAGLWDHWRQPDGEMLRTYTVITTEPNELAELVHDRMPVILPPDAVDRWMDSTVTTPDDLVPLLRPYPASEMRAYVVSAEVGNVKNDNASLVEPISAILA